MSQQPPPKTTQQSIVNLPVKKCPDCGCYVVYRCGDMYNCDNYKDAE